MVGAEATNQQEATDGECRTGAGADQVGPGVLSAGGVDRVGVPGGRTHVAGTQAGAGGHAAPVRAAGAALQHCHPPPAALGPQAGERRRVLQGADAKRQKAGCGFPVVKVLGLFDAFTGMVVEVLGLPLYTHDQSKVWTLHPLLSVHFAELKTTLRMRKLKSTTEAGALKELAVYCL